MVVYGNMAFCKVYYNTIKILILNFGLVTRTFSGWNIRD